MFKTLSAAACAALLIPPAAAGAHDTPAGVVQSMIEPQFDQVIPNIPGTSVKTVLVTYAPGDSSSAHMHARSAFIVVYVLEGEVVSAINDQPAHTYKAGEYWIEVPGDHHKVSANASKTKPAKLLAFFVLDSNDGPLTVFDHPKPGLMRAGRRPARSGVMPVASTETSR